MQSASSPSSASSSNNPSGQPQSHSDSLGEVDRRRTYSLLSELWTLPTYDFLDSGAISRISAKHNLTIFVDETKEQQPVKFPDHKTFDHIKDGLEWMKERTFYLETASNWVTFFSDTAQIILSQAQKEDPYIRW